MFNFGISNNYNLGIISYIDKIRQNQTDFALLFQQNSVEINQEIENFEQGQIGDCWLLSALKSLSFTESGKQIIDDAITENKNGSYSVEMKGLGTKYNISQGEIINAKNNPKYAQGDDDIVLLELAFEKALKDVQRGKYPVPDYVSSQVYEKNDVLNGGHMQTAIYLLTGNEADVAYNSYHNDFNNDTEHLKIRTLDILYNDEITTDIENIYNKMEENPTNYAATISFKNAGDSLESLVVKDVNGEEVLLANESHAWSIKSVQDDTITIVNPWDSQTEVTVEKEEIKAHTKRISSYQMMEA